MNKIVVKLGVTIMVLFLIVLFPLGYVANQIFTNFYYSQAQEELASLSQKYAQTITALDDQVILNMFRNLADLTNKDIYIVDAEGNVVADSGINKISPFRKDRNALMNGESIKIEVIDSETGIRYLGSGSPIIQSGTYKGTFFVLTPINDVQDPIDKIGDLLLLSAIGALLLAFGFTFVISRKMSDPLLAMEKATREIAKGNLDVRLDISSADELGSLGQAINDLAFETNRYRTNRKEFLANISHELRTPISYIQGYAQVVKQGLYKSEKERIQYLDIIDSETERMVRLINDLFDLSKMEEGKLYLQFSMTDVVEVVESSFAKVNLELKNKQITLKKEIKGHIPYLEADGIRLEQIFTNLLRNAIQYTEEGVITLRVWSDKFHIYVRIEDTGMGIPKEDVPLIFERFHRVEKSRSRELGGTGLGLAIVKNLVELQNGTIFVKSELGEGTTFQLSFPIVNEEAL